MPTYQYKCKQCGFELEEFQSMTEDPLVRCPQCKTDNLVRVLGTGGGVIFKGSGFYLTDYKRDTKAGTKPPTAGETKKEEKKESKDSSSAGSSAPPQSDSTKKDP